MLDYVFIVLGILGGAVVAQTFGLNPAFFVVPVIVLALPSVYATMTVAPHVPSDQRSTDNIVKISEVQPGEKVIDLGCGDGRIVSAFQKAGADAVGYELSFFLYLICKLRGQRAYFKSLWKADVSSADIVVCFLLPKSMKRVEDEIWPKLKPGCRLIVNTFPLPNIKADEDYATLYLYRKKESAVN